MKQIISTYTFDKTNGEVTLTDFTDLDIERVMLVVNVTTGTIIYQFNDSNKLASVSGNVLNLAYDTSSMDNSDKLMIIYDCGDGDPIYDDSPTSTLQETTNNLNDAMLLFIEMIYANQARLDTAGRQTVNIETGTLPAVTTVTTVTNLTNAINFTTAGAPTTIQNSQLLDPPAHIYNAFTL